MKLSTISAASTVLITSAYAQQYSTESFTLSGFQNSTGAYPSYAVEIVVDGGSLPISKCSYFQFLENPFQNSSSAEIDLSIANPLVVVSIEPTSEPQYNCTFTGADGSVTVLGGTTDVDPPQAQVSFICSS